MPEKPVNRKSGRALARRLRSAVLVPSFALLVACTGARPGNDTPDSGELLQQSLPVAAAALAAGQLDAARRLYLSLAERFPDAPEAALGLGYIAFYDDDLPSARRYFAQAADLASDRPAMESEALLGGGRAALAQGMPSEARRIFGSAGDLGEEVPSAPWIANGLAVAATLDADYGTAEAHYVEALRLSSGDPRITANFVRMLVAAGRIGAASRRYADHAPSYWVDGDGRILSRLIEDARQGLRDHAAANPRAAGAGTAPGEGAAGRFVSRFVSDGLLLRIPGPPGTPVLPVAGVSGPGDVLRMPPFPPGAGEIASNAPPLASSAEAEDLPTQASPPPDRGKPSFEIPGHSPNGDLMLILGQARRLELERAATSVSVAAPEVADVQLLAPDVLYIVGKGVGRTSIAVLADDWWTEELIVSVEPDLDPLRTLLAEEPELRGVRARPLPRGLALAGEVPSVEAADRAMRLAADSQPEGVVIENELRIGGPQQVNLEVQVAEVSRSVTENLGVNWQLLGDSGNRGIRIGRSLLDGFPQRLFDGIPASSIFFGNTDGQFRIMLDALATAGLANVLARPNVTAVSGESASFFSGGEFPLPIGFDDGVLVFEYKKYGILLDFVPTVVDAGRIVLTVRPEVSEPSLTRSVTIIQGVDVPVINVRRAETTVEVGDGESIVIAGLFRNASNTVEAGLPGLKDVPLFGVLFGTTSTRSEEVELLVIVTARLVDANAPAETDDPGADTAGRRADGYHY